MSDKYTTDGLIGCLEAYRTFQRDMFTKEEIDAIIARLRAGDETEKLYHELLYEVARKFPDETRHETARRYIRQAEVMAHEQAKAIADYEEGQ